MFHVWLLECLLECGQSCDSPLVCWENNEKNKCEVGEKVWWCAHPDRQQPTCASFTNFTHNPLGVSACHCFMEQLIHDQDSCKQDSFPILAQFERKTGSFFVTHQEKTTRSFEPVLVAHMATDDHSPQSVSMTWMRHLPLSCMRMGSLLPGV